MGLDAVTSTDLPFDMSVLTQQLLFLIGIEPRCVFARCYNRSANAQDTSSCKCQQLWDMCDTSTPTHNEHAQEGVPSHHAVL